MNIYATFIETETERTQNITNIRKINPNLYGMEKEKLPFKRAAFSLAKGFYCFTSFSVSMAP